MRWPGGRGTAGHRTSPLQLPSERASCSARDSTHWKTVPESQSAEDQMDGHRPLLIEKSQAPAFQEGPRETQMSAGRVRSRPAGSEGQEEGGLDD